MKTVSSAFLALTLICGLSQAALAQAEAPAAEAPAAEEAVPQLSPEAAPAPIPDGAHEAAHGGPVYSPQYGHGCSTCNSQVIYHQQYSHCCQPRRENPLKRAWSGLCNLEKRKNAWLMKTFFGSGNNCNQCCPQPVYYQPQPSCNCGN
ncbi:MAG: hypothetical protein KDA79_06665 [Planctomycetaceae bacterium]|nr:hypothetical protein [Planctomycetaceae bacterium]